MGTTNILDLNNRLAKVEKENVAQNSYTSLKNKPKINGVTLTGNKSLADIGAAAAADLGELTDLTTTDKSSVVAAINEVSEDTGWVQIETTGIYYRKIGKIVSVKGVLRNSQDNEWTVKATLPSGFRPDSSGIYRCLMYTSNTSFKSMYIGANGNISVRGGADVEFEESFFIS